MTPWGTTASFPSWPDEMIYGPSYLFRKIPIDWNVLTSWSFWFNCDRWMKTRTSLCFCCLIFFSFLFISGISVATLLFPSILLPPFTPSFLAHCTFYLFHVLSCFLIFQSYSALGRLGIDCACVWCDAIRCMQIITPVYHYFISLYHFFSFPYVSLYPGSVAPGIICMRE